MYYLKLIDSKDMAGIMAGQYDIVFAHPEALLSTKAGSSLMRSDTYQQRVCAVVIDEAHCIHDWYV